MKKSDMLILSILRGNCRISLTEMSRKTGIPVSTIHDKLKYFQGSVIRKNAAILDFSKLGFVIRSHVMLSVDKSQRDEFGVFLQKHRNVNSLVRINNGFDFLADVFHRDINESERFLDSLGEKFKIKDKKAFFIIEELKREGFMSDSLSLELV